MAVYKIIENGQVVNRIVADEEFMQAQYPQGNYEREPDPEPEQPQPE